MPNLQLLAERELLDSGSNVVAKVQIFVPVPDPRGGWRCAFRLVGAGQDEIRYAPGVDALQSIFVALDVMRFAVKKLGMPLHWKGAESDDDTGLYRQLPMFYGPRFYDMLDALVDEKVMEFASAAIRKRGNPEEELGLRKPSQTGATEPGTEEKK